MSPQRNNTLYSMFNFYMDDTGTKSLQDTKTRYFAYVGIVIRTSNVNRVKSRIISLRDQFFPSYVELKSRWFRFPELRQKHYLDPFNLSEESFDEFCDELFAIIIRQPIRCLGVVVDKERLRKKYSVRVFSPSAVCYDLLMQHVANFTTQYNGRLVNIIVDQMTGKNIKGSDYKKLLINQHKDLLRGHSPFYKNWKKRTGMNYSNFSEQLNFLDSRDSILIQIADLCAYNVMRQGRDYWDNFDREPFYPGYSLIKQIMHKSPHNRQINHFGALCYPDDIG